ncbi:uncharacterized protein ACN2A1_004839 isoform 1-T1 [Glossina fuscipes fuscipes]
MDPFKQQQQQMNDYWHIPRASLSPSTTSSSAASSISSTERNKNMHIKQKKQSFNATIQPTHINHYQQRQLQIQLQQHPAHHYQQPINSNKTYNNNNRVGVIDNVYSKRNESGMIGSNAVISATVLAANNKRGSRSSQGSSDSNSSTRSGASGSLLLTAANLERFAEIHKKQEKQVSAPMPQQTKSINQSPTLINETNMLDMKSSITSSYKANLVQASKQGDYQLATIELDKEKEDQEEPTLTAQRNEKCLIDVDPNLNFIKTKDLDTVSIASSMHFTMINFETGVNKKTKKGLCDRGRQVTVLITSMSIIFLLLIMGMVYACEMRAREMPQS